MDHIIFQLTGMARIRILILIGCICSVTLQAQNKVTDSLERILPAIDKVEEKISVLNDLTVQYLYTDLEKARKTAVESSRLASGLQDKESMTWAYLYEGIVLMMEGELSKAEVRFQQVIKLSEKLNHIDVKAYALNLLGNIKRDRVALSFRLIFHIIKQCANIHGLRLFRTFTAREGQIGLEHALHFLDVLLHRVEFGSYLDRTAARRGHPAHFVGRIRFKPVRLMTPASSPPYSQER